MESNQTFADCRRRALCKKKGQCSRRPSMFRRCLPVSSVLYSYIAHPGQRMTSSKKCIAYSIGCCVYCDRNRFYAVPSTLLGIVVQGTVYCDDGWTRSRLATVEHCATINRSITSFHEFGAAAHLPLLYLEKQNKNRNGNRFPFSISTAQVGPAPLANMVRYT